MNAKVKEISNIVRSVCRRNRIILANPAKAAKRNEINLHWFEIAGKKQNVGDFLSSTVVDYLMNYYDISCKQRLSRQYHLYAVGSIIDGGYQNATVWGSGLLRGKESYWWRAFRKLDIRCVRGPETRRCLLNNGYQCPEVYGDPAVLMPLIYSPQRNSKKYEYVVVRHMAEEQSGQNVVSPLVEDWRVFIDVIANSDLVISSSLHGIILAEAYGIPAVLLNDHDINLFKYRDYYGSTGRINFPIATSVEEALHCTPPEIPDFTSMRINLINAFPHDLWDDRMSKRKRGVL